MALVRPGMHGDPVGSGVMRDEGKFQQVRYARVPRVAQQGDLVEIDAETGHRPILRKRTRGENAMSVVLGTDGYRYEVSDNWAKLPPGMEFNADVAAVGVDKHDNVYAFNRGKHPMCVFDRDGNFLRSWGGGIFVRPHGVHMAPDDTIWLTDDGGHTGRQCTLDGKVLLTIGIPGKTAPYMSGEPFHRCTHTALSPQCDYLYISDGYGNSRVHKYTPDGKRVTSWGEPGTDPGQF